MFIPKSIHNDKFLKSKCLSVVLLVVLCMTTLLSTSATPMGDIVTIVEGDESRTVYTDSTLVSDIIGEQGIEVTNRDLICPAVNSKLDDDNKLIIKRLSLVDVYYMDKHISYWTDAETYGEFLSNKPGLADDDDICDVNFQDKLKPSGNVINIIKISRKSEQIESEIPYSSRTVYDAKRPKGERKVTTEGKNGKMITNYNIEYHNGVEAVRSADSQTIIEKPVDEVITEGTYVKQAHKPAAFGSSNQSAAVSASASSLVVNGQPISFKKVLTCQATAYDLSIESCGKAPGTPGYGITASGTYAKPGTVAVDPRVIPLGTKMYIVSTDGSVVYGFCTAEDTGGAIKGNKVDLFYNTKQECMQFGRRNVLVYIL